MKEICGVAAENATINDIQRWVKCNNMDPEHCNDMGLQHPITCSCPPCDQCFASCHGEF